MFTQILLLANGVFDIKYKLFNKSKDFFFFFSASFLLVYMLPILRKFKSLTTLLVLKQ